MTKNKKSLHSTFYILHSFLIVVLILTLSAPIAFAKKDSKQAAGDLKKLFDNTGGLSSVGKDEFEEALGDADFAEVKKNYEGDLDAVAKDEMSDYALSSYQEKSKAAEGANGVVEAEKNDVKPAPSVIPCPQHLPCIQPATQAQGAAAIREHVLGKWAVTFLTGFLGLAAATAVIFIIVGGLQMHLAFGNDEAVGTAKKTITWAVVGLVVAILSVAIVRIISNISF